MPEAITEITSNPAELPTAKSAPKPPAQNPAVARCIRALNRVYKETPKNSCNDDYEVQKAANQAYREAMPNLYGIDNIRDFIACVTFGMLINTISYDEGTKLLYAAQVAFSSADRSTASSKTDN